MIGPGLDGKHVARVVFERELAPPPVIVKKNHRSFGKTLVVLTPPFESRTDGVVSIAEDVSFHDAGLAGDALGGITPTVDAGRDSFDHDVIHRFELSFFFRRSVSARLRRVKSPS